MKRHGIKTFSIEKDPASDLPYFGDWTDWLAEGDTIADSEWIIQDELTSHDEAIDTPLVSVWLSGGTAGVRYEVINRITTAAGEVEEAHISVKMTHQF